MTKLTRQSKKLSWLLRHGAVEAGLPLDPAGWASVREVLTLTGLTLQSLDGIIADNNKTRFARDGDRVRASQGHSAALGLDLDALEASWRPYEGEVLWHGTRVELLETIAEQGLLPMTRTHVHLAPEADSKVGRRSAVDVLLRIDPQRLETPVFVAPNGVCLTRAVAPGAVVAVHPQTNNARRSAPGVVSKLGWALG